MFKKEKIKDKKGLSIISTIVAMVIFSTLISGFTAWFISLNNNVNLTGDRLAEMSIVYDKWNLINSEDFDALEARIDGLSSRTETKTVSSIYNLSVVYGTEGKFINGECVSGTATDEEQRCLPVAISVTNTTLPLNKPYALATTRVASKDSSSSWGPPDWANAINIGTSGTASGNGYLDVEIFIAGNSGGSGLSINGLGVQITSSSFAGANCWFVPIGKGDHYILGNGAGDFFYSIKFIPCK